MKKLFYLIPLVLIILNVLPVSLYKDTVKLDMLNSLTPSHWRVASENLSASINLGNATPVSSAEANQEANTAQYVSLGSTFRGFPFGAYFTRSSSTNSPGVTSSFAMSGYSILWAFTDLLLIVVTLLLAFFLTKKQKPALVTGSSPVTNPLSSNLHTSAVDPQQINPAITSAGRPNLQVSPELSSIPQQPASNVQVAPPTQNITSSRTQQDPESVNSSDDDQRPVVVG